MGHLIMIIIIMKSREIMTVPILINFRESEIGATLVAILGKK